MIETLHAAGCPLYATEGTAKFIADLGIPVTTVTKLLHEDHPNVVDVIRDRTVGAVINTLEGGRASHMRDALAEVARHPGLSGDVGEIVGKALAAAGAVTD